MGETNVNRILILVNADKPGARETLGHLCPWVEQRARVETLHLTDETLETDADLIVVLGGDGSIL